MFGVLFPDDCRVCGRELLGISRIPVCPECLRAPEPLLADYFCANCRTPFLNAFPLDEQGLCRLCRAGRNGFDSAYSFGAYDGVLRTLIHVFKYGGVRTLAKPLAVFLGSALPRGERFDLIVPMPMHWRRRWERGFNQARLLARAVGKRSGIPVASLARRRAAPPQAGLTNAQRRLNVAGIFRVRRPAALRGRRVLLIDDVLTTGATAAACAQALKQAGAASVTL
ncbi:MAG: ComF family protein, partial [Bryobacteraceae bacterium]